MTLDKALLDELRRGPWTWEQVDRAHELSQRATTLMAAAAGVGDDTDARELALRADRALVLCLYDGQGRGVVRRQGQGRGVALLKVSASAYMPLSSHRSATARRLAELDEDGLERLVSLCHGSRDLSFSNASRHFARLGARAGRRTRGARPDAGRVVSQTVSALAGLVDGMALIDPRDLSDQPKEQLQEWATRLAEGRNALRTLAKEINSRV